MNEENSSPSTNATPSHPSRGPRKSRSKAKLKRILILLGVLLTTSVIGFGAYSIFFQKDSTSYLAAARALEAKGDRGGAMIQYKNALQSDPDNLEARMHLGGLYYANNQYEAAEKELLAATKTGQHAEALPRLARTLIHLNQHQRLLDEVQPSAGASPAINAEILALRARAQLMLGDSSAYESSQNLADAQQPEHPASQANKTMRLAQQGKLEEALALAEAALARSPEYVELLLIKGDLLASLKRSSEATKAYDQAVKVEPANLRALMAGANLYMQDNQLDQAANRIKAARAVSPKNLIVRYQEALLEFKRGRIPEALAIAQEVGNAAPDFVPARLLAGSTALTIGRTELARKELEYVVAQSPENLMARKLLAVLKMQSGQGKEAKELLSKLDPKLLDDPMLLSAQGNLALRNRDFAEARRSLERAAVLRPDQPKLLTELAASQIASGDESAAIASLEHAAELDASGPGPDLLLIQTHLKAKRYDAALKVIDRLEKRDPKAPMVANLRGGVAAAKGDLAQARTHFTHALQLQPAYLPAANNLAQLDVQAKDFKSARQRFEKVIQHDAENAGAWISLAKLAAIQKDEKTYLENLGKAKQAKPADVQARELLIRYWLAKKDYARVLTEAREGLNATGNKAFYDPLGTAHALSGNKLEALAAFQKWVEAAPKSPIAHFRLAQAQESNNKRTEALSSLDKALNLAPDFPDAVLAKAVLLGAQGKVEEGLSLARDFQKRHPKSFVGYTAEASVQAQAKRPAEAAKLYERAADLSRQGGLILQAQAAYAAAGQTSTAEKTLLDWLGKHPKDYQVRRALAQRQLDAGRHKEAASQYEKLLEANPNDLIALNNLAWAYGELKDGRAIAMAERAYKLHPGSAAVMDTLGWLLVKSGQAKQGVVHLREAVKKQPDAPEIGMHLAEGLASLGQYKEALAIMELLLGGGREFPQKSEAVRLFNEIKDRAAKSGA